MFTFNFVGLFMPYFNISFTFVDFYLAVVVFVFRGMIDSVVNVHCWLIESDAN